MCKDGPKVGRLKGIQRGIPDRYSFPDGVLFPWNDIVEDVEQLKNGGQRPDVT